MAGWHHQLDEHGFGWTPGVSDGQGGLVYYSKCACCVIKRHMRLVCLMSKSSFSTAKGKGIREAKRRKYTNNSVQISRSVVSDSL